MSIFHVKSREPGEFSSGSRRIRKTPRSVYWGDRLAKSIIAVSGIGTIVAVLLVGVFLLWVTLPLFRTSSISNQDLLPGHSGLNNPTPLFFGVDEYQTTGWILLADGSIRVLRLDTGETIQNLRPFDQKNQAKMTAFSYSASEPQIALGFDDGSVQLGELTFDTEFFHQQDLPENFRNLPFDQFALYENSILQHISEDQFRLQQFQIKLEPPLESRNKSAVLLLDHVAGSSDSVLVASLHKDSLELYSIERKRNLFTGETQIVFDASQIPFIPDPEDLPQKLFFSSSGSQVFLTWNHGLILRFNTQNPKKAFQAETFYLDTGKKHAWSPFHFLNGRNTFLAGNSEGKVRTFFTTKSLHPTESLGSQDESNLVSPYGFPATNSEVTALGSSLRSRMFAVGHRNGAIELFHGTSKKRLAKLQAGQEEIRLLAIAPKDDGLWAFTPQGVWRFQLHLEHPEVSFSTLFLPVWYEGYQEPTLVWQSSSGSDDFEAKVSLIPLVFGTLKATFYSLIFGVPIALLAAVYTSEFLHPRWRGKVKQTVELMASLPSVVLGFLAASIFSPFVENVLPAFMTAIIGIPLGFLLASHLWQFLPEAVRLRLRGFRLGFGFLVLCSGFFLSVLLGPWIETLLFSGNMKLWLDRQTGSAFGGWLYLFFPLACIGAYFFCKNTLEPALLQENEKLQNFFSVQQGFLDFSRFLLSLTLGAGLAAALALAMSTLGLDTRGAFVGTFVQRNSLVVGLVMGFAIIPIIFTLAEDALSMVPEHLRTASLGAGATPWQTARYVVIPAAMSGIFSAVMIGLGRAVGETMIVLMAVGNTPILDWNIFNGFRALSANIAVELPEAVKDSSHYRILFLSGLILFAMTAVLNTLSEAIRLRFRGKVVNL